MQKKLQIKKFFDFKTFEFPAFSSPKIVYSNKGGKLKNVKKNKVNFISVKWKFEKKKTKMFPIFLFKSDKEERGRK